MPEATIYVHILAHLPHYYPLYMAAQELSTNQDLSVRIKLHERVNSLILFERAEQEFRQSPKSIHLVISGEHESDYGDNTPKRRTKVSEFVCASLLLERTPLWIKAPTEQKTEARAVIRDPLKSKRKLHLPPAGLTISDEILGEFKNLQGLKKDGDWDPQRVAHTTFDFVRAEKLVATLQNEGSVAYFSIYPPDPARLAIIDAINDRLPSSNYGFSAVWVMKNQAIDRSSLEILVKFLVSVEFFIEELFDCDRDILSDSNNAAEGISELLESYRVENNLISIFGDNRLRDTSWHGAAQWMLERFVSERIWAYNHALQFRNAKHDRDPTMNRSERLRLYLANCNLTGFNPHCLTEHLFQAQLDAFNDRINRHIGVLIRESDALDSAANAVKALRTLTTGSASSSEKKVEDALSHLIEFYLKAIFSGDFHHIGGFAQNYQNEGKWKNLIEAPLNLRPDLKDEMAQQFAVLKQWTEARYSWVTNSGLFEERFRVLVRFLGYCLESEVTNASKCLSEDIKVAQCELPEDQGEKWPNPLLLYEMKALTNGRIPGSWVIGIGTWSGNPCIKASQFIEMSFYDPGSIMRWKFPAVKRNFASATNANVPITYFNLIRVLSELRGGLDQSKKSNSGFQDADWNLKKDDEQLKIDLNFNRNVDGDFSNLAELIYSDKPRLRIGDTGDRLRLLHGMGLKIIFKDWEDRKIALIFPRDGVEPFE